MLSENGIPEGWQRSTLGEIARLVMGQSPDGADVNDDGNGTPFLQGNAEFGTRYPTAVFSCTKPGRLSKVGDILISVRAPVGEINVADREYCIGRGLAVIRMPEAERLFGWFLIEASKHRLRRVSQGSTFDAINKDDLAQLPILLPTDSERPRIGATLNAVDDAIERTRVVIDQTRRLRTALLQDLLTRGLPGRHSEFKEVRELGTMPASWDVVRLDTMAKVDRGKFTHRPRNEPKFYGGDIPFIQTGDVAAAGDYLTSHSQTLNKLGLSISRMFPAGTILFVIAGSVGEPTIASYDVAFPDSVVGITPKEDIDPLFLLRVLQFAQVRIIRTATESAQANISLELLRPLPMPLPGQDEREAIATILRSVEERVEKETSKLDQLTQVKTALSQALLTGRVRLRKEES